MNETVQFEDTSDEAAESMTVDFDNVDDSVNLIPKGKHLVEVEDLTFEISQNSGNKMWSWVLSVSEGDFANRKLFFHTVFEGNGLPRTKRTLKRIIPDIVSQPFDPVAIAESGALLGRQFTADVTARKYQGEMRNNVRDLYPADVAGSSGDGFLG